MAWNDTFTSATDASAVTFGQMFADAINERIVAFNARAVSPLTEFDDVEAGDDFQDRTDGSTFNWGAAQQRVYDLLEATLTAFPFAGWADPDQVFDGDTPSASTDYEFVWADALARAGVNASGFTRKYPREIANTSAAGTLNDIARNLDDGKVYKHNGSAWVRWTADPPDTLEAYGFAVAGDYIGPWIFNELRNVINTMTRIVADAIWDTATVYHGSGSDATWANAKTAADANYPSGAAPDTGAHRYTRGYNGGSFFADTYTGQATMTVDGMATSISHDVDFYARADTPYTGSFSNLGDGPGTGWASATLSKFDTITSSTADELTSDTVGSTTKAATWAAEPTSGNYTYLGYMLNIPLAVITYDFQYGPA